MFLQNKYTNCYYKIISNALNLNRIKSTNTYYENHHIIPKCMNGSNKKENLVLLTYKEHFICHLLLRKMVDNPILIKKLSYAFRVMSNCGNTTAERYNATKKFWLIHFKGENNPNYGKHHSKQAKQKISEANKGKLAGDKNPSKRQDVRDKISLSNKGKLKPMISNTVRLQRILSGSSRIYKITDTITKEEYILLYSEFCRKFNIDAENARSSVYNTNKYKHWIFEQQNIILTKDNVKNYMIPV
jgi:NUMOD3 motif